MINAIVIPIIMFLQNLQSYLIHYDNQFAILKFSDNLL